MKGKDESSVSQNILFLQQNPQQTFSFPVRERAGVDPGWGAGEDGEKQPRELCMEAGKHPCRMTRERMVLEDTRYQLGTNIHARKNLISESYSYLTWFIDFRYLLATERSRIGVQQVFRNSWEVGISPSAEIILSEALEAWLTWTQVPAYLQYFHRRNISRKKRQSSIWCVQSTQEACLTC